MGVLLVTREAVEGIGVGAGGERAEALHCEGAGPPYCHTFFPLISGLCSVYIPS